MKVPTAITKRFGDVALKTSSASPQLLFAAGVIGVGATVVLACRATLHLEEVVDKSRVELASIVSVNEREAAKQRAHVYLDTSVQLGKLYAPAIICGVISVGALAGSHNILSKRNAGLTAAYTSLDQAYKQYRERVRGEVGEERELELYNDVQMCEIEDPETGKKVKRALATGHGAYVFTFDKTNKNFDVTSGNNFFFLQMQENAANDRLKARGHLFLNDVLESLGFEHTSAGAVTGWIDGEGDSYVSFGCFNAKNGEELEDFMAGRVDSLTLNFNVDGVMYDRLK